MTANNGGRKPVVWIVNQGGHAYKDGERFGRLVSLTSGKVNCLGLDRVMVTIAPKLNSATVNDFVLISGAPILNALVVSMWLTRFPKVNLLQWSERAGGYIPVTLHNEAIERMVGEVA